MVPRCCSATVRIIAYQNSYLRQSCLRGVFIRCNGWRRTDYCCWQSMGEEGHRWRYFFSFSLWQLYIILLTILRVFKMDDQSIMPYVYIILYFIIGSSSTTIPWCYYYITTTHIFFYYLFIFLLLLLRCFCFFCFFLYYLLSSKKKPKKHYLFIINYY